jgi:hypothetical protein
MSQTVVGLPYGNRAGVMDFLAPIFQLIVREAQETRPFPLVNATSVLA